MRTLRTRARALHLRRTTILRAEPLEARETPAAAGTLDLAFGIGGITPEVAGAGGTSVAVDSLGRVVAAGIINGDGGLDFVVARYTAGGFLDSSFGDNGQVVVDFAGGDDVSTGVGLDSSGRIVVGGYTTAGGLTRFAALRLTPEGALDSEFGAGGMTAFHVGSGTDDRARGIVIDPVDDSVILAGETNAAGTEQFAVARLTVEGVLDSAFAAGGTTFFSVAGGSTERGLGVTLDSDRRIVVIGFVFTAVPGALNAGLARLLPNGMLDPSFAGDGTTTVDGVPGTFINVERGRAVTTDPSGSIYMMGDGIEFLATSLVVAKLAANGSLDASFGTGGIVEIGSSGPGRFSSLIGAGIVLQPDGKIVVAANDVLPDPVFRFTSTGALDASFNPNGSTPGRAEVLRSLSGVALAPGGRIVVLGHGVSGLQAARLHGVDRFSPLVVSGALDGSASLFAPDAASGAYPDTAAAVLAPFPGFTGNVRSATGDVDGDGTPDTILVTGPGTPIRFAVVSGVDHTTMLVPPTSPFAGSEDFTGGGFVSTGDFNKDGRDDMVFSPDLGGGPRVTVFTRPADGTISVLANFFGIDDPGFLGGARTAAGDVNRDGVPDLAVAAGFLGGPRVALYDGKTIATSRDKLLGDFFVFELALRNGVYVAIGDLDGDGFGDLIFGAGQGGAPRVLAVSGRELVSVGAFEPISRLADFFVGGDQSDRGGVRVAAAEADSDNRADLAVGSGSGAPAWVRVYLGKNFVDPSEPIAFHDLSVFGGLTLVDGVFVG